VADDDRANQRAAVDDVGRRGLGRDEDVHGRASTHVESYR
jgi:hypothetical protein